MGKSTWRRSLERLPGQARAKKPQPALLCRMGAPETKRDESDWKRYGQTAACFRVTRSKRSGDHISQQRDFPIICGKTRVSKITAGVDDQRSEVRNRKSVVSTEKSPVEATFLTLNKERFRFFDHAAQHSANRYTFSGQGMVLPMLLEGSSKPISTSAVSDRQSVFFSIANSFASL